MLTFTPNDITCSYFQNHKEYHPNKKMEFNDKPRVPYSKFFVST